MKFFVALALCLAISAAFVTVPVKKIQENTLQKMMRINFLN